MKIYLDKLKHNLQTNKKMMVFLIGLSVIGIIFGTLYVTILNNNDQALIKNSIEEYLKIIETGNINYLASFKNILLSNTTFILLIWLLGISAIGIPIIIIIYFSKTFIIGFSLGSIILKYNIKGVLFALFYVFPHAILNIFIYSFLIIYSCALSLKLVNSIIKKTTIDFKPIINKYLKILLTALVLILITTLLETFLTPFLIKTVIPFIK